MKVLTIGSFDTPHIAHCILFKKAAELGDLIIGINSDEFIREYKGKLPLFSYNERYELISQLGYKVAKNNSAGRELISFIQPDYLVIGSDWLVKDYLKQINVDRTYLDLHNITLVYIPYTPGISTTEIKRRCQN